MKLRNLLLGGLAALALSGCTEYQYVGADGFSCEKGVGGYWLNKLTAKLIIQKGNQGVIVNYFPDWTGLRINNLSYQEAINAVVACERAIDDLPKKVEKEE